MKTRPRTRPCPGWVEAIDALTSGIEVEQGVREHLLECPACNAYHRSQRRIEDLFHETAGALEDPWLAARPRRRRISPWRITAAASSVAAVLAVVAAVAVVAAHVQGDRSRSHTVAAAPDEDGAGRAEGVTAHDPATPAGQDRIDPSAPETGQVDALEETRMTTTSGEHMVRSFKGGLRLSLTGEGDAIVQRTDDREYRILLTSGLLVGDVPDTEPRMHVTVAGENMQVRVKGTLFSVLASGGRISSVEVERGVVETVSLLTGESRTLEAGQRMDIQPLAVAQRPEGSLSLVLSFLVEIPADEESIDGNGTFGGGGKGPAKVGKPASAKPCEPTAYDQAMALRKAGKYEEAVEAFLEASSTASGLTRERCLYQAASLSLAKLADPEKTILLAQSYMNQFPEGFYIEEIMILSARAQLMASEPEKARAMLVDYLDQYPDGSHQALAHLLLGKIFATTYDNCKLAESHLLYVEQAEPTSAWAKQARKILDYCATK